MLNLLLNASIFIKLDEGDDVSKSNYYQLAGPPISDSLNKPFPQHCPKSPDPTSGGSVRITNVNDTNETSPTRSPGHVEVGKYRDLRTPGEIMFVRSRMFYSKPAYNAHGEVVFGLRHIHVLNRFPNPSDRAHAIHVLRYIFPRQFNLHNVFTSTVDRKETIQPLKDYTLREHEIALQGGKRSFIPKRLKGKAFELVKRMMRLHRRCSYHALIEYYCPVWVFLLLVSSPLG
ncbi:hypothetical protein HOY82DRAFT_227820 [Tuber indicum]|nr:hypothetical protein HOY82DRAFT_227820 [Tuber indicum]